MWKPTRPPRLWLAACVCMAMATACGRGTPTSPTASFGSTLLDCHIRTAGVMTADINGVPWVPVSTRAYATSFELSASDCRSVLNVHLSPRATRPGTYTVEAGDVDVGLYCDGAPCGIWRAAATTDVLGKTTIDGAGTVTVTAYEAPTQGNEGSGKIEGTFSFTLVPAAWTPQATGTKAITNGRFGTGFVGLFQGRP